MEPAEAGFQPWEQSVVGSFIVFIINKKQVNCFNSCLFKTETKSVDLDLQLMYRYFRITHVLDNRDTCLISIGPHR